MKTLSIQQPWASLICAGIKDVENRTWKAASVPGRILIHASSKKVPKNFNSTIPEEWESYITNHQTMGNLPNYEDMPVSAIIGYVTVTGFEEKTESLWDGGEGAIKWTLKDAWLFDEPILNVKGKLNLFEYPLDENNLPPAHQVELRDLSVDGDEIVIPITDDQIDAFMKGLFEGIALYVTDDNYDILCEVNDNKLCIKPYKTAKLVGSTKTIRYELSPDSGVFAVPDIDDETKPYMILYHNGYEKEWLTAEFFKAKLL